MLTLTAALNGFHVRRDVTMLFVGFYTPKKVFMFFPFCGLNLV